MNKVTFPLKLQIKGPEVANLQEALGFLGFTIAESEATNQRYGASTRAAVKQFQFAQKMPETGEIDEATAKAINTELADNGVLDPSPGGGDLPPSNPPTQDPPPGDDKLFSVQGEVVKPDGTALPDHIVRAYDRALCDWRQLGDDDRVVRTNTLGRYQILYSPAQLKQWGKTRADLKVEVFDPATGDTVLAESPLILRALPHETINFSIGAQRYRGPDEFTRVERALAPQLTSHDNDLSCVEVADVMILAREARLLSSKVAYYVKARRWSAEFGAPAAMFYGLMRRGEPTRIDALLAQSLARLWAKLEEAKSRNLIALPLDDAARTQLAQLQQGYLARPEHPYAQLLGTTTLTAAQTTAFTQQLTAGRLTGDAFWQALEAGGNFSAENITDLRAAFELQTFSGNTSLTVRLRGGLAVRAPREVAAFSVEQWHDTVLNNPAVEVPDEVLPGGTAAERRVAYAQMLYRGAELRYPTPSFAGQLTRNPLPGQDSLQRFFSANPDFEFRDQRVLNFLRERPQSLQGLPETARDDLLRVEQLFHLVPDEDKVAVIQPLWSAGLRSAPQIAYLGRTNLTRRAGAALDTKDANRVYRKAVHITSLALNVYLRFHPGLNRLSLAALQLPQPPQPTSALRTSEALASSAITMPEWEELFGSPDACECSHCESAISPAAYLVDTLAYLGKAVDADGNNALDELLARRPDLGELRLTCENTETPLPHIDIVIQILEAIVVSADGKTLSGAAIGETTWDSDLLAAQPEYLKPAAYDIVRLSKYPFTSLPFDLWAEEGRRYLRQMGIARDELMQVMPAKPGVNLLDIASESLGMSGVERDLIRQAKTKPADLAPCWGIDLAEGTLGTQLGSVEALLKQAQIDYDTLLRLLNTRYVNPDRLISVSFAGTPCSLDGAVLVGEGGLALVEEPFRRLLDRLHRFLRLQRRLACSEYELDMLIHALGVADFDANLFLPKLADMQALRGTLRLSLPELSASWADLDTWAFEEELPSQYEGIYLNEALFPDTYTGTGPDLRNAVFALRGDRADLAITTSTDTSLSPWLAESDGVAVPTYTLQPDYAVYIQSATRLTADDLLLLVQEVLPKDPTTGHVALNLANGSLLYRMASLARALKVSVKDVLRLVAITGVAPLRTASETPSPIDTLRFHDRFADIDAGAHSVEELAYLLLHESTAVATLAPTTETIDAWLASMSPNFIGILAVHDERITDELKASLTQSLGSALGVDPAVIDALLFTHRAALGDEWLTHVIVAANVNASGLPTPRRDFATVFGQLHKFGLAWNGLALDLSFLPFVLDRGPGLGWTDIASLPMAPQTVAQFGPWRRLVAAADLQTSTFTLEQSLFTLMEDAAAATDAQALDPASFVLGDFLAQISESTTWPLPDVTYLTGPSGFNLSLPSAMRDEQALVSLKDVFDLIRTKSVAAEQAHAWTIAELTFAETQSIKQSLSLAYAPDRWLDILGSIQDALRTLKRDALLGHALATLGMEDSDAFYEHYLIDPAVSQIDRTSRIVLAHSAVQLFAQRILLNLEAFTFEALDAEAWQWRKKYRVWEAARRVFLHPENWLEPELRDNKSAFFKELEDALLQEEVTTEAAERIYHDYLIKLDQVSRLEILGVYEDTWTVGETDYSALHVVARTVEVPAAYFCRRLEDHARWTPWERIQLDLSGDHLIPITYNGKLFLFWPEFKITERDEPSDSAELKADVAAVQAEITDLQNEIDAKTRQINTLDDLTQLPGLMGELLDLGLRLSDKQEELEGHGVVDGIVHVPPATEEETFRYDIELGMAWCTYGPSGTSPKFTSREKIVYQSNAEAELHYFSGWVTGENLLRIAVHTTHTSAPYVGYFYLDNTKGELHASEEASYPPQGHSSVYGAAQKFQSLDLYYFSDGKPRLELEVSMLQTALIDLSTGLSKATRSANFAVRASTGSTTPFSAEVIEPPTGARLLFETLTDGYGRVHYLHQQGLGGGALSPFFFSTNLACYFVTQELGLGSTYSIFSAKSTAKRASSSRVSRLSNAPADEMHFQSDGLEVIDRGLSVAGATSFYSDAALAGGIIAADPDAVVLAGEEAVLADVGYQFTRFYDPYTSLFLRQVSRHGVAGLLSPDKAWDDDSLNLYRQMTPLETFSFAASYDPNSTWVNVPYPIHEIDFDHDSPCGWSNWELFFHIPLLIATRLMQNQRYAEARQWFHHIFNPTATDGEGTERFWRIRPFYEEQVGGPLASLESLLTEGSSSYERQVEEWGLNPFQPHVIARLRISAYMQAVVMRYLTCLREEADMLFRRDRREDINEARQLYLLAAAILGDRPYLLPAQEASSLTPNLLLQRFRIEWYGLLGPRNPLDLLTSFLSADQPGAPAARSNARAASGSFPVDAAVQDNVGSATTTLASGGSAQGGSSSVDTLLLFCIPHNDMLYEFWDTVADRLFKIRHSMNLSGQVRQLALFAPPIDPALLVRASAAGISIEDILSGLFAPRSNYRFSFMLQKALELCGEARGLGGAMLAALQTQDGERLALLRSTHEVGLLESMRALKKKSVEEAESSLAGLIKSRESAEFRAAYHAGLERISTGELSSLEKLENSRLRQRDAEIAEITASVLHSAPSVSISGQIVIAAPGPPTGWSASSPDFGSAMQGVAGYFRARSAFHAYEANKTSTIAGYDRRKIDWNFQADLAKKEVGQLDQQILAAEIRKQIAETDRDNLDKQITQAQEVEDFLKFKFTNQQLYSFMVSKLASVHFQAYQMAYQLALQTEAAFRQELGPDEQSLTFIKPDNWDSLKKGLLAGELLQQQLRQMETAHLAANKRELEMTKHVSLFQLNPVELLELRQTGSCEIHVPEVLYAMDFPAHYYRRIKSVRVTIPCVVGPYANVSATLSLLGSWTRRSTDLSDATQPLQDTVASPQPAIATSSANQDGGAFELSFSDPRYLTFEGAGAISTWRIELPSTIRSFDYATISDVVMHVSYTARDGGPDLKTEVNAGMVAALNDLKALVGEGATMSRLFSLRHEFPAAWNQLLSESSDSPRTCTLQLSKQDVPSFLDYAWVAAGDGVVTPTPLVLNVTSLTAYLSPKGSVPAGAESVTLNQQAGVVDMELGIPVFDLTGAAGTLSGATFDNANVVDCVLTLDGATLHAEEWNDLYLLMDYEVTA